MSEQIQTIVTHLGEHFDDYVVAVRKGDNVIHRCSNTPSAYGLINLVLRDIETLWDEGIGEK